jgi:hypothetical protein
MEVNAYRCAAVMEKHFQTRKGLGMTQADSKEEFYGFAPTDIVQLHEHKQGFGSSLFFRIKDGRVVDVGGQAHDPDPVWYDATTH